MLPFFPSRRLVGPSNGAYSEFPDSLWKGYSPKFRVILQSSSKKLQKKVRTGFEGCLWVCALLIGLLPGARPWYSHYRGGSVKARSALSGSRRGGMRTLADRGRLLQDAPFSTQKFLLEGISTRRAQFATVSAGLVSVRAKMIVAQLPPAFSEGGENAGALRASCKRRSFASLRG